MDLINATSDSGETPAVYRFAPGVDYEAEPYATDAFDYGLPGALIAQEPLEPRDRCRLMVLDRDRGTIDHHRFSDLAELLGPDDLLVINDTRVLPARLTMRKVETGGTVEVLLLRRLEGSGEHAQRWECLVKPARSVREGQRLEALDENGAVVLDALVLAQRDEGLRIIELSGDATTIDEAIHRVGSVPLPPYIHRTLEDTELYQTVYADCESSAAAPTAGLHFTDELLTRIMQRGIEVARIRLDVGLDTFRPVSVDDPKNHRIHTEFFCVDDGVVDALMRARARGGRIVAVGTTTARALETAYQVCRREQENDACDDEPPVMSAKPEPETSANGNGAFVLRPVCGTSGLFIVPGYRFGIVDALVTNFHVPRSTLLMMVSAFADRDTIMAAYGTAREHGYRFLSFGDAMLIL